MKRPTRSSFGTDRLFPGRYSTRLRSTPGQYFLPFTAGKKMNNPTYPTPDTPTPQDLTDDSPDAAAIEMFLVTPSGRELPIWLLNGVRKEVTFVLPDLIPGVVYPAKNLCGTVFWKSLKEEALESTAGKCLAYLVSSKAIPLSFAGKNSANTRLYRLK